MRSGHFKTISGGIPAYSNRNPSDLLAYKTKKALYGFNIKTSYKSIKNSFSVSNFSGLYDSITRKAKVSYAAACVATCTSS
jgi:hypothetical protein